LQSYEADSQFQVSVYCLLCFAAEKFGRNELESVQKSLQTGMGVGSCAQRSSLILQITSRTSEFDHYSQLEL